MGPLQDPGESDLTRILTRLASGEDGAADALLPRVYVELRAIAGACLRRQPPGSTLQPTELVHEAFLRLFDAESTGFNDRKHFFALSARAMRQVLVDRARTAGRLKRKGGARVTLSDHVALTALPQLDVLDLDAVLSELATRDSRQARIVELRFFGGLEVQEVALVLDVSKTTVEREWRAARAWLGVRLAGRGD